MLLSPLILKAQENHPSGHPTSHFAVGIDNTRLIYGKYSYKDHLSAKLNISVYSEKISFQYIRATVGYRTSIKRLNLEAAYFWGNAFNASYYNTGAFITADIVLIRRLLLDATLAPWYDSNFGYTTCWEGKIGCKITDHINLKLGFTSIPEYRMSENRGIACVDFHVSKLYVTPYLTAGLKASDGGKNIRIGFRFGYQFK